MSTVINALAHQAVFNAYTLSYTPVLQYGTLTSIANGSLNTLATYTVPTGKVFWLGGMVATGEVDGRYVIKIDGVIKFVYRTSGAERNAEMLLSIISINANAGAVITLEVEHFDSATASFEGSLLGAIVDTT